MGAMKKVSYVFICVGFVGASLLAGMDNIKKDPRDTGQYRRDVRREKRFRIMGRSALNQRGVGVQSGFGHLSAALVSPPMFNGTVNDAVVYGGKTYAVGDFTKVSDERMGYGIPVDMTNGQPLANFDPINGPIENVIEDGAGGWFVTGDFTRVGTTDRAGFAHILSNGKLDPSWNLNAGVNGWYDKMCLLDGNLYLLVELAPTEDTARLELHSYSTSSRNKTNGWILFEGSSDDSPFVYVIKSAKDRIYFGGLFSSLQGESRNNLAAFDIKSGRIVSSWVGETDSIVEDILVTEKDLIVGGSFSTANGFNRKGAAAFDLGSGNITAWNPNLGGTYVAVNSIARIGDTIYLGGYFDKAGVSVAKNFAAVSLSDGKNKQHLFGQFVYVHKIVTKGTTLYFSGYRQRNATTWDDYWAFEQSGALTGWALNTVWGENQMAAGNNAIFLSVSEGFLGGEERNGLAVFDNSTGKLDGFNPNPGNVSALYLDQDTLFVGKWTNEISAINLAAQTIGSWLKGTTFDGPVNAITKKGNVVYVGGTFRNVNKNISRNGLAAFAFDSGALLPWSPKVEKKDGSMSVNSLAFSGDLILVGGRFETIDSQKRENLAAIDVKGVLQAWNPSPNNDVYKIVVDENNIYVGGQFNQITGSGYSRNRFAAFDSSSLALLAWDMKLESNNQYSPATVFGISVSNGHVYVSGVFDQVNGTPVNSVAAFKRSDWTLTPWKPNIGDSTWNSFVTAYSDRVLIGGIFSTANGQIQRGLAVVAPVDVIPTAPAPTELSTASVQATSVVLQFNRNGNPPGTTFVVQQVASLQGAFQTVKETTVSPVTVSSLMASTEYYFRVMVKNPDGSLGEPSNVLLVKTGVVLQLLKAQSDRVSQTEMGVSWASVGSGWTYWLDVATNPVNPPVPVKKLFLGEDLKATVGGLTPNMKYYGFVKACQGDRCSDYVPINPVITLAKSPRFQVERMGKDTATLRLLPDGNASGTEYIIEKWTETTGTYDLIYTGSPRDIPVPGLLPGEENRFRVTVVDPDGVSTGAVNEVIYTSNDFSVNDVMAYPVPFKAGKGVDSITFDQMPDDATAKIYTTAGTLVKELRGDGEVLWNVHNEDGEPVASGVYFVRVSGRGGDKTFKIVVQR